MADLAIIIVAWNSKPFLGACLGSIIGSGSSHTRELVVVDNGSTDGSAELVRKVAPDVRLIINKRNEGFAAANNSALSLMKSRYALLLNPDTVVLPGALDAMVDYMDINGHIWALGPMMLNGDGSPQLTGVRFPTNWNIFAETLFLDRMFPRSEWLGAHRELYRDLTVPRRVDYVQGSCLLLRSAVLDRVGTLDEQFFMYFEETDWCYRVNDAGGEVWFYPTARVTHFGGGEIGHYDRRRLVEYHRSILRFYSKHYTAERTMGLRFILVLRAVIRLVLWSIVAAVRPSLRRAALSSAAGYLQSLSLILRRS